MVEIRYLDLTEEPAGQAIGGLLTAYHRQTEDEKASHGVGDFSVSDSLPVKYQREIDLPLEAFANSQVLVAQQDGEPVGMMVLSPAGSAVKEVKRLWVEPFARGAGVGAALLQEALHSARLSGAGTVRLTVWEWRYPALRSYLRFGFRRVPSWEERAGLQCLELQLPADSAHR
ncbi:GNAT family N-acetyltransferase [Arthrobacter sp. ISL-48]|uniref:GNAT family N-acetyltransferase n=1 Tax=Arthrobacter sp. ISL-48 TaxID=2819110 RepID=UPI001BE5CFAC|nr:GNAT family N-acetyltransferase [Arthrobacter sp. ISL-48]MBT2532232.1 GNAT family N-acetyltransferase [Arthrobacter sp. ISL-48]